MKLTNRFSLVVLLFLAACTGWPADPHVYTPPTPPPSRTPRIQTATPLVQSPTPGLLTETPTATQPLIAATDTQVGASETPTLVTTPFASSVDLDILGCDTGVDLTHGMGEVTNAYVRINNRTAASVPDLCATLRGLDEARPHPDKTKCIASLPSGYRVTFKLTVDTTYQAATPIQVDVTSGDTLLVRSGEPACKAIGLLLPDPGDLGVTQPIP